MRGHPGGGAGPATAAAAAASSSPLPAAEGIVCLGSGVDRLGRPLVIVRLAGLGHGLVEACGKKALLRCAVCRVPCVLVWENTGGKRARGFHGLLT